ncbi:hypothetical protein [Mesorhizobium sp.]|uniref:hypothetical protein n=1 Tax=Mesorhizobium sp. TaxID=1871066 RepID=UPI001214A3C0|nr:hypothetical protein [Mesorhizobium sp.]TIL35948.1 MAG: hypothetical protein E5Y82_22040 [Mesorhizobium sp.]
MKPIEDLWRRRTSFKRLLAAVLFITAVLGLSLSVGQAFADESASSFRGIQLGMTEVQLARSLDRSFVLKNELPAPKAFGKRTDGGPNVIRAPSGTLYIVRGEQQCGGVIFRHGEADRLDLYQCYFDIAGGMSIQDFAQQVIDTYGLEDGMAGSSQTRGDGAYQFEYVQYMGVKQVTSERFTVSSNGMSNSVMLTVERIPHASFDSQRERRR